jgi:hypothetical protein
VDKTNRKRGERRSPEYFRGEFVNFWPDISIINAWVVYCSAILMLQQVSLTKGKEAKFISAVYRALEVLCVNSVWAIDSSAGLLFPARRTLKPVCPAI